MRAAALAVLLAGCAAAPPEPPVDLPGSPAVEVRQPDGEPVELVWAPPEALWVEVREAGTGRVVWRAAAGPTRLGPRAARLRSPLAVAALGPPPGEHPPDGGGATAPPPEPFVSGTRYDVTVAPCPTAAPGGPCEDGRLQRATFVARDP